MKLTKRYYELLTTCVLCLLLIIAVLILLVSQPLIRLFSNLSDVNELAMLLVPVLSLRIVLDGLQIFLQGVIKGLGLQKWGLICTLLVSYPLMLSMAMILTFEVGWGLTGIWWADTVGIATQMTIFVLFIS